ncbi:MAG TPA: CRISPR-associated endonuclease Cas2 [Roseiflexaceae bacterium]|nr:CRISPR-associated endonuclease Cas2 [Roseiflexaceae bacterium]
MFTIISYDVVQDRRRTRVAKLLEGYGTRVQYSVFECDLDQAQLVALGEQLRLLIDVSTDSVRCYLLDALAVQRIRIVGIGQVTVHPSFYFVRAQR